MRRFKIKNRRKRKYTKRSAKSVPLKRAPYMPIKTFAPVIPSTPAPLPVIPAKVADAPRGTGIHLHQGIGIKAKSLLIYILIFIVALCSIILKPYLPFGYLYREILIVVAQIAISVYHNLLFQIDTLNKIIITIQNITNENNKTLYKIIFTIIYTIDFTNSWLISQVILFFQAIGHTIIYYWEKLINIISAKFIQSGQELKPLSPSVNFILNELHRSAQGLFSNMYNIFKSLSTKNITITN
jgi:uncharacterized membrane protein